jgi:hypothetical protein
MDDETIVIIDYENRSIRLTTERYHHILEHPEMLEQLEKIIETLANPQLIVATHADESVRVYHRFYDITPVTSKFLQIAVKILSDDAFILTAFFSKREKKGRILWKI